VLTDELPGIDWTKAATWSNGSVRTLAHQLDRMLAQCGDDPAKLSRCMAAGDLAAAALITHDLMAAAATVGATALVGAARQLNRKIRAASADSSAAQEALENIATEFSHLHAAREILRTRLN